MSAARLSGMVIALAALAIASPGQAQGGCPALRWTTLGTAGGPVPTFDRSEPANLLDAGGLAILVEAGDGTVAQLARAGRNVGEVRHVFLSHLHLDHTAGLAAVVGLRWMNEYPGTITVYGPRGTKAVVDGILLSMGPPSQIGFGIGVLPPRPADRIAAVEIGDGEELRIGDVSIRAGANNHFDSESEGVQTTASLSYRFTLSGRSITYTGDTGPDERVTRLATGSDMLVSEVIALDALVSEIASHRPDMSVEHRGQMRRHLETHHVAPEAVGQMARDARVDRLVLTHFAIPGPLRANEAVLRGGVRTAYSGPVDLARDLASFDIGCSQ